MHFRILFVMFICFFSLRSHGQSCKESILHIYHAKQSDFELSGEYRNSFINCLSEYLKLKTISPQGQEHMATSFFADIFKSLNIPFKVYQTPSLVAGDSGNFKTNLIATLPFNYNSDYDWRVGLSKKSIIMTHHMDVVDVVAHQWVNPEYPFAAKIAADSTGEMYLWGRGALDMKGIGIAQLFTMIKMIRNKTPLKHDLHFLALADEEQAASGALGTLHMMKSGGELYSLTRARVFLNEGGGGIINTPVEGINLNVVSVEQKGGAWIKVEHNSLEYLLNRLSRLNLIDIDEKTNKKLKLSRDLKCQLVTIQGPEVKPNVIVSQIKITLACKHSQQSSQWILKALAQNFSRGLPSEAEVKVALKNELFEIEIQTKSSSHGSVGMSLSALDVAAMLSYRLRLYTPNLKLLKPKFYKKHKTHATQDFIDVLKNYDPTLKIAAKFAFIPFIRNMILKGIEESFGIDGLFRTSCQFTNLNYSGGQASAVIDCRLLHTAFAMSSAGDHLGDHAGQFVTALKRKSYLGAEVKLSLISGWNYTQSDHMTPEYEAIARSIERTDDKTVVAPYLNPAGSDDAWFRNPKAAGIDGVEPLLCFGVFPANFSQDLIATMHGSNERFPLAQALPAQERYYDMIRELDRLD